MAQETELVIATVVCTKCGKPYSLLDTPLYKAVEQPKRYPGKDPIIFLCCDFQTVQPDKVEYRPIGSGLIGRNDYEFQRERVVRIANELAPGKAVEFDETKTFIRFRIFDPATHTALTVSSGEWISSELADKSDGELRAFIKQLSSGKIG